MKYAKLGNTDIEKVAKESRRKDRGILIQGKTL